MGSTTAAGTGHAVSADIPATHTVAGDEALTGPAFEALPVEAQHAVLDAGIDYLQFIADPDARARGVVDPRYVRALAARYALPPGSRPLPQAVPPPPIFHHSPPFQVGMAFSSSGFSIGLEGSPGTV